MLLLVVSVYTLLLIRHCTWARVQDVWLLNFFTPQNFKVFILCPYSPVSRLSSAIHLASAILFHKTNSKWAADIN